MHRPRPAALLLAALIPLLAATPMGAPSPAAAAGACGTYASHSVPPPTIRVYRTATGAVDTVDFRTYVKNVLSREWISSWTTESLRSGALAVKNYAWYQVLHWRGYVNGRGECFDVFDSTRDQHYDPSRPTYASMAAAVDATWATLALKGGRIFATYYNAGAPGEACGANANGWQMFQWGTQACGLAGRSAAQILATYYPGVVVGSAPAPIPPPATPAPTPVPTVVPTPTPMPTPVPTPVPSASAGSPAPSATEPPATPVPTPVSTPVPTPMPTPPPPAQMPGGGQAGLSAPPPPPPADPEPIVVTPASGSAAVELNAVASSEPAPPAITGRARLIAFEEAADRASARAATAWRPAPRPMPGVRWLTFRSLTGQVLAELVAQIGLDRLLPLEHSRDDELRGGDVLDRQPDRLEGGHGLRVAGRAPARIDRPDLHQVRLAD